MIYSLIFNQLNISRKSVCVQHYFACLIFPILYLRITYLSTPRIIA